MNPAPLTRQEIITALVRGLEPLEFVNAMWEGGSAAFNRLDQWSDIDLQFDVADDKVEETFQAVQAVLERALAHRPALPHPRLALARHLSDLLPSQPGWPLPAH